MQYTDHKPITNLEAILIQRSERYGDFKKVSEMYAIAQETFQTYDLPEELRLAFDAILAKLARIANGDPYYIDSWQDIAGYATLVVSDLEEQQSEM